MVEDRNGGRVDDNGRDGTRGAVLSVSAYSVYCTRKEDKVEERKRKEEAGRMAVR